ncbi:MAG: diaminopimelate epimerase [Deltaproteobacteria bacterium]
MSKGLSFTKMVASGNDFCVIDNRRGAFDPKKLAALARRMCDRKFGAGADGLLVVERSRRADARMRIFNADGSEAEMCGNGARCFALFLSLNMKMRSGGSTFETKAGIIDSVVKGDIARVRLTDPGAPVFDLPVPVLGRSLHVDSINTGVPHAVVFVEGLSKIDVDSLGRAIRYHERFAPAGTNADFIEITGPDSIAVRTYERGVEGETLACGTGSCASALVANAKFGVGRDSVRVRTEGGEELKVFFTRRQGGYTDVRLEGKVAVVYSGTYNVNTTSGGKEHV